MKRFLGVLVACAIALVAGAPARADEDAGPARATMTCDHADAPGRVRCEAEARVGAGESIAWGDVTIVRTPPFADALRGRIGPHDATTREAGAWRWAFALVARGKGSGELEGRVRLVVCRDKTCGPRELPVVAHVGVGD
jgi:hypothetical protein